LTKNNEFRLDPRAREQKDWYDKHAEHYDSHWVDPVSARVVDRWNLKNLTVIIKEMKIERVLDLGCGTGKTLSELNRFGFKAVGYDISASMLKIAKKRCQTILLVKGDAKVLPFPSDTFDMVVTNGVWHHFSDIESIIREIGRILRRGGLFAMLGENNALYNPNNVLHRFWRYINLPVRITKWISGKMFFNGKPAINPEDVSYSAEPEGTEDINPFVFSALCKQVNLQELSLYSYDHIPRLENSIYVYRFILTLEKIIGSLIARYEGHIIQGFWVKK